MYIKSIKTQGFKSFADKIEFDLDPGISAIVGPNGSGKSNVVDAILWVLGEQSVKSLRGESAMSDIIFSGSKTRDEQKKAYVAITFDNSDKRLNTEFKEVEIKRVIYKTGENEYYINNAKVRLKDITDLLIDVTSKFNIISQGNINALVENKSSERRILFESAAGVLKYKKRKEEALKKLEGTKENLTRINLILKELTESIEPLESQKDDAIKYLDFKKKLEEIEIALTCEDIENFTNIYNNLKNENDAILKEIEASEIVSNDKIEIKKLEVLKLDEKIKLLNDNVIKLTEDISSLSSQKTLALERNKYNLDKNMVDQNIITLENEKLEINKNIDVTNSKIEGIKENIFKITSEYQKASDEALKLRIEKQNLDSKINELNKESIYLQNKINIEKDNIENSAFVPKSVSSIISNPRLEGIHNTIISLIEISDAHLTAIDTALSASSNFIVVDNMKCAKSAINYLKDNSLGRATFFPLDTIKSRYIGKETDYSLKSNDGYIGIASDLVSFDEKYRNIIENQLGNVLVVDSLDDLFNIAKNTSYRYKIVSLEGDVVYPGGSVSGGNKENKNHSKKELNNLLNEQSKVTNELNIIKKQYDIKVDNYDKKTNDAQSLSLKIDFERHNLSVLEDYLLSLNNSLEICTSSLNDFNTSIDERLDSLLKNLSSKEKEKSICENDLHSLESQKFDLSNEIIAMEKENQEKNAHLHMLENKKNENDIEIGKYEIKIDNLLNILSEDYQMTFEHAQNNYSLNIEEKLARENLSKYKSEIKHLNNINVGAIDEYNRLKKRFDFLSKQKDDLEVSSNELLNIISEMDEIMKEKFKTSFDQISEEFSKIFRLMFKGGNGVLKLSDTEDLLNSGINILAVPPGKKLNSTAYLSGGEKALTAICLIFAILSVKPVPFIVLDEAEAALDEENVNMFGDYLKTMKKQSQFILITHKKKMMEYADVLYGITMQESGVSKLVSVKLDDN